MCLWYVTGHPSLLLRSFLGEEEAQIEECSHNGLSAVQETSQGLQVEGQG